MSSLWAEAHKYEGQKNFVAALQTLFSLYDNYDLLRDSVIQDIRRLLRATHRTADPALCDELMKKLSDLSAIRGLPLDRFVDGHGSEKGLYSASLPLKKDEKDSLFSEKSLAFSCAPSTDFPRDRNVTQTRDERLLRKHGKPVRSVPESNLEKKNPKRILIRAHEFAESGDHDQALSFAELNLPEHLAYTTNILRANAAISKNDESAWLQYINSYFAHFGVAPIRLEGQGSVFDRLNSTPLAVVAAGPLISVIMPAWNAAKTVRKAADSILNQTWRNLELIIVDDCSTDETWSIVREIAAKDNRVSIIRNRINVGPYVSKNIALMKAKGEWITGHDADDWALPERLERHMDNIQATNAQASLTYMIRLNPAGVAEHFTPVGAFSFDGAARLSSISTMFNTSWMRENLGFWDSVRFGADSEMISRARAVLSRGFKEFQTIGMICLELPGSLTNDPVSGIRTPNGLSDERMRYKSVWSEAHGNIKGGRAYLSFPQERRVYSTSSKHAVPLEVIQVLLNDIEPTPDRLML